MEAWGSCHCGGQALVVLQKLVQQAQLVAPSAELQSKLEQLEQALVHSKALVLVLVLQVLQAEALLELALLALARWKEVWLELVLWQATKPCSEDLEEMLLQLTMRVRNPQKVRILGISIQPNPVKKMYGAQAKIPGLSSNLGKTCGVTVRQRSVLEPATVKEAVVLFKLSGTFSVVAIERKRTAVSLRNQHGCTDESMNNDSLYATFRVMRRKDPLTAWLRATEVQLVFDWRPDCVVSTNAATEFLAPLRAVHQHLPGPAP